MALYAGRSVANLKVNSFPGGTSSRASFYEDIPAQREVFEPLVHFRVDIEFHDHPAWDNGKGRFKVWLDAITASGIVQVDYKEKDLGTDERDGDWYDSLTVKHPMQEPMQQYRVRVECRTKLTTPGTSANTSRIFTCMQPEVGSIGDFTLDYIPLSIVYCPPGQDMTNSLSQTSEFATQYTIGNSAALQSTDGQHAGGSLFGVFTAKSERQESQEHENRALNGIRTSYFRNTVVTADNQRAIGRAYWGPLSDIFVVLVNPRYSASKRADGTVFYEHRDCRQVVFVPAHQLLRPNDNTIASSIPSADRRKLLDLDPFMTNLDMFFPDSGVDINLAANPYADPSGKGRAECIGMWHMAPGTELNYSIGDSIELRQQNTREIIWTTTMRGEAAALIGGSASHSTSIGIQHSKEKANLASNSASCYLIKNQNDTDTSEGIKIYYDNHFSTLMFRKIRTTSMPEITPGVIQTISDVTAAMALAVLIEFLGISEGDLPPDWLPDLTLSDLGLSAVFPELSPDDLRQLVQKFRTLLRPDKCLIGSVEDGSKAPVFFEDVELVKGHKAFYVTQTDGVGLFRFDNLLPGEYEIFVGGQGTKQNTILADNNTGINPKRIDIKDFVGYKDVKKRPRWQIRELLGISSEDLDAYGDDIAKATTIEELAKAAHLSPEQTERVKRRISIEPTKS